MENIYFSQKIEHQLPEWLLYQLWYILSDYDCFRGERQKCLRIVQNEPPEELFMSFLTEQPVSARDGIRRKRTGSHQTSAQRKRGQTFENMKLFHFFTLPFVS